ncbi:MAG: Crp/Fnr family transcriptional regulator [Methylobacter sp.]|uniref:Crp/Fnr family transcriptional regulator n=1 Tax=Candidatus Methylobacter titanis TaxID=3053457 RepID=A0AA43TP31_9GAMM|nr:Crp/Fnr family transcriptional regulator [Candidatus Methylobacter titanis]MDI1292999.1 Crp/Fnr family transcriptional regulator [Candidatus Methylobacter titanis]
MSVDPLLLKQFDLFKPVPVEIIGTLSQYAQLVEVPRRKVVMEKNQHAHSLGLLMDGRLQGVDMTLDGREAGLYFVEPNDFFGELAVVDQLPTHEFVISLAPSRFVTVPANIILQLINEVPQVAAIINTRLARRLREALVQRTLLTMSSPLQRVCAQLIQLTIKTPSGEQVITLAPTHQEIAIMINVTRETVTRVFQKLQTNGVIVRDGSALQIKNIHYLNHIASGEQDK